MPVTLEFQDNTCPECRGEKLEAAPEAPMHEATAKIAKYCWREIFFEGTNKFYDLYPEIDPNDHSLSEFSFPKERGGIEEQVMEDIKNPHEISPKYHDNQRLNMGLGGITPKKSGHYVSFSLCNI